MKSIILAVLAALIIHEAIRLHPRSKIKFYIAGLKVCSFVAQSLPYAFFAGMIKAAWWYGEAIERRVDEERNKP